MNVLNRNTFRGEGVEGFFVDRVAGRPCDHRDSGAGGDAELDAVDLKGEGDGGTTATYIPAFVGKELFLHLFTIFQ